MGEAVDVEDYPSAAALQRQLAAETAYLDELLRQFRRPLKLASLARRSVAAPLPAPVRLAVRTSPSIKAESAPVVASKTVTTA